MITKNSGKKFIFKISLSIILMIGAYNSVLSQTEATPELTKFLILVEATHDGVKLTGSQGCGFIELNFSLKSGNSQLVDQFGMSSLKRHKNINHSNLANFLFKVKKTKKGLSFEGLVGTKWEKLSFSCPKNKCHQFIDQNGMTEVK